MNGCQFKIICLDTFFSAWRKLEKRLMPAYVWQADPLTFWRERILFCLSFSSVVLGVLPLAFALWVIFELGLGHIAVLDIIAYLTMLTVLVFRNWSLRTRGYLACLAFYILGAGLHFFLGYEGTGYIWLFAATIMVNAIIGLKAAIGILGLNAITLISVAFYSVLGSPAWAQHLQTPLLSMLVLSANFIFINAFVTIALAFMLNGQIRALENEKKTSEMLRLHQERFLTVLNSIDAAVYVADLETFEVLFMNKNMIDRYGRDMTGSICWKALGKNTAPCARCLEHLPPGEADKPQQVHSWQEQDPKTHRWYVNYERRIKWTEGRPAKITIATDITELKRMEAELRQAHKMEAFGTLAGGIAHDFNNILASMIGFTELALDDAIQGSLQEANLHEVFIAGKRAQDLVRQILTFARQSDEKREPLVVSTIVKETLKLLRSTLPATIAIKRNLASNVPILGNPIQVHQIIMNLCTNAYHAMDPQGGILEVTLRDIHLAHSSAEELRLAPGDYLRLTVSDTGTGIPAHIIGAIFEPYFTTKALGEGTGMGLAVVQGIVESYDGRIVVDSQPGHGTTFNVFLPVTDQTAAPDGRTIQNLPSGTEHILLVDDELAVVRMGSQILERLGYTVTMQTSSMDALALFRTQPRDFDLVITDMTMPRMTGDVLAREILQIRPDIPIILCTGYSKSITEQQALDMGISAFTYKPIVKKDLAATVRQVLDNG